MSGVETVRARVAGLQEPRHLLPTVISAPDPSHPLPTSIVATIFSAACYASIATPVDKMVVKTFKTVTVHDIFQ
jgi:hypothetical protein